MGMGGIDFLACIGMQLELRGRSDNVYDRIDPQGGMGSGWDGEMAERMEWC